MWSQRQTTMASDTEGDWEDGSTGPAKQYSGYTGMLTGHAHRVTSMRATHPNLTHDGQSTADHSSGFAAAPPAAWSGSSGLVRGGLPPADYYYYGAHAVGVGYAINAGDERPYPPAG